MTYDLLFDLFQDSEDGPLWRRSFADLDGAKSQAQDFADEERQEFFVRRFEDYSEVGVRSRNGKSVCPPCPADFHANKVRN